MQVMTRAAVTSYDPTFQTLVRNLAPAISHYASVARHPVSLTSAETVLLVMHPDNSAELWVDTAAVSTEILVKRDIKPGTAVFQSDIADVIGMSFPLISIAPDDRVLCIFRVDWSFGLFFDFNHDKNLDQKEVTRTLGTLYRQLRYRQLYEAIANEGVFSRLTAEGWFPFVELIGPEFQELVAHCEAGFDLPELDNRILSKFDQKRLDRMLDRWLKRPHLAKKEKLLKSALAHFAAGEPVAVIKIILTEIEGVLAQAYREVHGDSAKTKTLLEFAINAAKEKSGAPDTLLFPEAFGQYLRQYTFADFDPLHPSTATSRHAVGHGAAEAESYTLVRALQAILTLDQLAFYT